MNDTVRGSRQDSSPRNPADLAPSVERDWSDAFILEQRLLCVSGRRIGDALATVEAHVAESGESAREAFGDPNAYARDLAEGAEKVGTLKRTFIAASVLGPIGLLVISHATSAWLAGESAVITIGVLVGAAVLLVAVGALMAAPEAVLRLLLNKMWVGGLVVAVPVAVSVLALFALPGVALTVPASGLLGLGALLIAASTVLYWIDYSGDDAILAPGEEPSRGSSGRLQLVLVMPLAALAVAALAWVVHVII